MRHYIRLALSTLKVFLLFTGCTIIFYYAIMWVNEEYENRHRYDQPEGDAVKVSSNVDEFGFTWFERILLFYFDGE
jgi:Protein of unknown function (DUF4227)